MATYPNPALQADFSRYQLPGLPGQIARAQNGDFTFDVLNNAVEVKPGYGVYAGPPGPTVNEWILPASAPDQALVTHIVSFEVNDPNTPLAVPAGNATSSVVYPANSIKVKAMRKGPIYVLVEVAVYVGETLEFNFSTFTWQTNTAANARVNVRALSPGQAGDVVPVQIDVVAPFNP